MGKQSLDDDAISARLLTSGMPNQLNLSSANHDTMFTTVFVHFEGRLRDRSTLELGGVQDEPVTPLTGSLDQSQLPTVSI